MKDVNGLVASAKFVVIIHVLVHLLDQLNLVDHIFILVACQAKPTEVVERVLVQLIQRINHLLGVLRLFLYLSRLLLAHPITVRL
jgi:hypothetical protein